VDESGKMPGDVVDYIGRIVKDIRGRK
jgi:hypothetical protein